MPAGWNQTSGTFREGPIDENTFWMLFNYVFSDSSAKRTTYKFGLIKSILDNLFNTEGKEYSLFISYENLFAKFAENYWNLVTKYHLKQMFPDGRSEYSKIEQTFMALISEEPSLENLPFSSIEETKRQSIIKQIRVDCRKNVLGALHRDFQSCLYAFDLKGDGLYLNAYAFNFMLKYKVEIEKLNYYAWAKLLEKIKEANEKNIINQAKKEYQKLMKEYQSIQIYDLPSLEENELEITSEFGEGLASLETPRSSKNILKRNYTGSSKQLMSPFIREIFDKIQKREKDLNLILVKKLK